MNSSELKDEWKRANKYKYTNRQKNAIIEDSIRMLGEEKVLIISTEEVSELIDAISVSMSNKVDYFHILEEIVDVRYCMSCIKTIFNINDKSIKLPKKVNKSKIFPIISSLSKVQKAISKYLRGKNDAYDKLISAYNDLNSNIMAIQKFFGIKSKDIEKMVNIKYHRMEGRIIYNDVS